MQVKFASRMREKVIKEFNDEVIEQTKNFDRKVHPANKGD
jgi:hypothetical protein